jgi:GMP synthase-like glutamine amidotransferase
MTNHIDGLSNQSVLYVSATVHPDHELHKVMRTWVDPLPDMDLGRVVESSGDWIRKYFVEHVIDGTTERLPVDLSRYSGLVVGCSLHFVNPAREPIHPWQQAIMDLIRLAVHEYQMPYLGLCGGGQLGLVALGGRVGPNPKGVGFFPEVEGSLLVRTTDVELTDAGLGDPLLKSMPKSFGLQAIHSDYLIEAPEEKGFRVLAHAADIPNQIVAYGDRARLLGVHPEMSRTFILQLAQGFIATGAFPVPTARLQAAVAGIQETTVANDLIVRNFLSEFCAPYEAQRP